MARRGKGGGPGAWLGDLPVSSLLTVPGDVVAGYVLAAHGGPVLTPRLAAAAAASLWFYAGGVVLNNFCNLEAGRGERPRGRLPPAAVGAAAAVLFAFGESLCAVIGAPAVWIGFALVISVLLYDLGLKDLRYVGPLNMGFYRGLNLVLGAAAAARDEWYVPGVGLAFNTLVFYVAAVAHLARCETASTHAGLERWAPAAVLATGFALFADLHTIPTIPEWIGFSGSFLTAGLLAIAIADTLDRALPPGGPSHADPHHRRTAAWLFPHMTNLLLGSVLLIQAGFVMAAGRGREGLLTGLVLLALWPVYRAASRHAGPGV